MSFFLAGNLVRTQLRYQRSQRDHLPSAGRLQKPRANIECSRSGERPWSCSIRNTAWERTGRESWTPCSWQLKASRPECSVPRSTRRYLSTGMDYSHILAYKMISQLFSTVPLMRLRCDCAFCSFKRSLPSSTARQRLWCDVRQIVQRRWPISG